MKTIKILLVSKLLVLTVALLAYGRIIYFGDKPLTAADEKEEKKPPQAGEKQAVETPKDRKSFLDDLLDLPDLDPKSAKKEEIGRYLSLAERKKQQIERRVDTLDKREKQLKKLEAEVENKIKKLEEERMFFAQTIQKEKEIKEERLKKLVSLYAKMEPKKAGPVFENMDKDLVVSLFKNIRQKQITAILENMDPQKSVEITEYYGRIRSGREYDLLKQMNESLLDAFDECKGMPKTQR